MDSQPRRALIGSQTAWTASPEGAKAYSLGRKPQVAVTPRNQKPRRGDGTGRDAGRRPQIQARVPGLWARVCGLWSGARDFGLSLGTPAQSPGTLARVCGLRSGARDFGPSLGTPARVPGLCPESADSGAKLHPDRIIPKGGSVAKKTYRKPTSRRLGL